MKRALAILLAVVFVFCGSLSASAAAQSQNRIVYVASNPVPKEIVDYARDWFSNRIPVQDVCNATGLILEQVKKVKLCRPFTVESFYDGSYDRDAGEQFFFPLLYGDKFVATLSVSWTTSKDLGYRCNVIGGEYDSFSKGLNSLSSTISAPIMFVFTANGTLARDSKNKVTVLRKYSLNYPDEIETEKLAISKLKMPQNVVTLSAATAYPDKIFSQQLVTGGPNLTVKDETNKLIYQSEDGGKTWKNNAKPPVYISIENTAVPKNDGKVQFTVHNNTQKEIYYGRRFALQKWNGQKWVKNPKFDEMHFDLDAAILAPKASQSDTAVWHWAEIKTEVGKYKLVKEMGVDNRQFTCEAEFVITEALPVLTVKDETNKLIYQSNDGGKTWKNNAKPISESNPAHFSISNDTPPPFHISIEKTVFKKEDGKLSYTVCNNTKVERFTGEYFTMRKWNGQKWVKMPEIDSLEFNDIGIILPMNSTSKLNATWKGSNIKLEAGKYKLIKKLNIENHIYTCEAEFTLE